MLLRNNVAAGRRRPGQHVQVGPPHTGCNSRPRGSMLSIFVSPLTTVEQRGGASGRVLVFKSISLSTTTKKTCLLCKQTIPDASLLPSPVCFSCRRRRRNSELCLFGFNHREVSAQLCKTCDGNLSKKHTEEQREAQSVLRKGELGSPFAGSAHKREERTPTSHEGPPRWWGISSRL